jgi:DNA-binding CsgD family transcriptional regulator/tetratricopeptide (TPR) repeat protein
MVQDLPGSLRLASPFPFVGRWSELATLRQLMPWTDGAGRRIVLLGGAPGAGKSRLAREFAAEAAAEGALVLYGGCVADVRTPYGPFVEALEQLARTLEPAELRAAAGAAGGELARLLPELRTRLADLPEPVPADPDTERHRLHSAVTDLLSGVGRTRPVLLILEDGHWADAPTLLLLRHLARAAGDARLLVLATFRDTEADVPAGLAETLADLRRSDDAVRVHMGGLSGDDVAEFVRRAAGAGSPELAGAISELTEGNPFLVCELWRAVMETSMVTVAGGTLRLAAPLTDLGTPESVREVVNRRLARLEPGEAEVLELAAVAGPEFELELLREAAAPVGPPFQDALDEAVRLGILEELPSRRLAYRFTHELVRRALYDRLSAVRRAELHLRVGTALESTAADSSRVLADLAHHFAHAAGYGVMRGIDYNRRAARAASAALAFDEAAARLDTALELGIDHPEDRAEALLELGTASQRAGKSPAAMDAFRAAAGLARELGSSELLARAAIGFEDVCWRPGIVDAGAIELCEEAVGTLELEDSVLRVQVLGGLARALDFRGDHARASVVRSEAIAMARRLDDDTALATILGSSYWSHVSSSFEQVLAMLDEARDLGERLGNTEILAEVIGWRVPALVGLSQLDAAEDEVAVMLGLAERAGQPFVAHVAEQYGSALALARGRLADAEASALRSDEWSELLTGRDASGVHGIQMFGVKREQGRLTELAPVIRILASGADRAGPWQPGLACLLVELDMRREAQRQLERIALDGLEPFRSSLWLASLTYLADACAAAGDETVAAMVYRELEPLAGANVMIGHLVACYGAADRYLGMLAATLGDGERARRHFEHALELNRRMGATTWLAHTAFQFGRLLRSCGPGEQSRGDALLAEAGALAEQIGMPALLARVRALGTDAEPPPTAYPDGLSAREAQILKLVARGLSNREIGATLFISEHTAANHIRSILRKTGSANRTDATSYAHRHGLAEA